MLMIHLADLVLAQAERVFGHVRVPDKGSECVLSDSFYDFPIVGTLSSSGSHSIVVQD